MKIAIIGSTGLLGKNLAQSYKSYEIKLFSRTKDILIKDDLFEEILRDNLKNWQPDIIINAIGLVNLQLCEEKYFLAKQVNVDLTKSIAIISKEFNSYYIHISTDHFYSDSKFLHNENDKIVLLNNYAKTKSFAEEEVIKTYKKSLIVRTNIIGFRRNKVPSFFEWLINSLEKKDKISLFDDFITSPISVRLLANILIKCYDKKLYGVYNIASKEPISKYDFGKKVAKNFNFEFSNVKKTSSFSMNTILKRSVNNGLDVSKIEKELNQKMPTVEDTIEQLYDEYKENK